MIASEREEAIVAALRGSRAASDEGLRELSDAIRGPVFRLALRMCGNAADADEAVQETLVDVLRGIDSFRAHAKLSTWVYRIAIRAASRVRARHARDRDQTQPLADEVAADPNHAPSAQAIAQENAQRLLTAMDTLPAEQRAVLSLSAMDQLPQTEIAEILGIPVGTVYSRLKTARDRLRTALTRTSNSG